MTQAEIQSKIEDVLRMYDRAQQQGWSDAECRGLVSDFHRLLEMKSDNHEEIH